jgi:hypothetical protein
MNMWEAIVLIVIVASVAKTIRARHQVRIAPEQSFAPPAAINAEYLALRREVEDLRERIKVLERIATDGRTSRHLADEIEALR